MLANFGAVIFGAIELSIAGRNKPIAYKIGVCFYLQVREKKIKDTFIKNPDGILIWILGEFLKNISDQDEFEPRKMESPWLLFITTL